ncbi:MAG TPA: hypothetical protein VK811_01715, partial [Candidatus Acidoferrum sp.]|nr:hypothetical protein [Candidatus Acidoferrum sp.]
PLPDFQHSSYPITMSKRKRAYQKPTETGQKIDASTLDLGCEELARPAGKNGDSPSLILYTA